MDILLIIIIVLMTLLIFGLFIYIIKINKKLDNQNNDQKQAEINQILKTDFTELTRKIDQLKQGVNDANLRMSHQLNRNGEQMQNSMSKQISESTKLVSEVSKRLTKLDETNRRVIDVADELKTLQNVLSNPKQRGVFGEYYLKSVLENVLPPKNFQMQYGFKDGQIVDAAIFLDKGRILPIDSKFSLENYNRMLNAETKTEKETLLALVKKDLKNRIDETSKYIRPEENTMDFAFMFIPSESLYYDLLINNVGLGSSARDLIEYAFRDRKVIIVSPTSFMAYLQTVLQGLRSLQIEQQAKEIQKRVGMLGKHIKKSDELMAKLGKSLSTTVNHYNNSYKEIAKVDKDIAKIAETDQQISEPVLIDKPGSDKL